MAVLVLGLGNTLMSDDGFGVHVVEALRSRYLMPEGVALLDGGTLGLDLLPGALQKITGADPQESFDNALAQPGLP